ncbi:regulatory protein (EAL domain) [Legionella wadsworthii]|uniref:Regulatory protein (EAL domain) n=2 Tax=Legionella wadsworthii TaxID=28088 RepID=A0A378LU64_9GAMM|nr:regulatory protein (EAL domain) [Legionella wadsworthii]
MRKTFRHATYFFYKQFKLFWIFFTIILFTVVSYINWYNNVNNSYILVTEESNKLASNLDKFINEIFLDLYRIPSFPNEKQVCKDSLFPYLQSIIINHPLISGLAIRDNKNQVICSTLPHNQTFLLNQNSPQTITGPLKIPMFHQSIYAIQKKIGEYQVEIVIMASVLENELNISNIIPRLVTLYDENQKKEIIQIGKVNRNSWVNKLFPDTNILKKVYATAKLNSLDGILIKVAEPDHTLISNLWYNQVLLSLDILVLSIFLYFIIMNHFSKYYSLHGAMKQAIRGGQFYPVYQPLFDANTGTYSGAEVLLRWQDNYNEIIMPDLFIDEAENTGLIVPITLQIIETTFIEAKPILNIKPSFHLSFNICALHFTDKQFFPQFYKLIRRYAISPNQILLEITERYLLDMNNELFIKRMQELRNAGISLAIDDYGTGHSSISYLQYYPFNFLKIDKIFIQAIGTKAITETLNDAIIHLAKKIKLTIIAEGVETKEQFKYLLKNEVQILQGWYFSKALPIEQLIELLQGEKNE